MSTSPDPAKPDLSSLRIGEGQRKSGKTGKRLGVFAAMLGVLVIVTGAVFAFRDQKPVVEVATVAKARNGPPCPAERQRLRHAAPPRHRRRQNHRPRHRRIFR